MSDTKCAICNRIAYPLESLTFFDKVYHKSCFRCSVCKQPLNSRNFKEYEGKIYCFTHTPRPQDNRDVDN